MSENALDILSLKMVSTVHCDFYVENCQNLNSILHQFHFQNVFLFCPDSLW